jgi:mRNA-degrading endonuclease toxin of MazEF toxin-antitoxin module
MTEQVRTISRDRLVLHAGVVDDATLGEVDTYLRNFLDLSAR